MLLMIVLIIMIVSAALLLAVLSGFFPFVNTHGNMMQYTTAYYGALSAVERGVLATSYAGPGFDGESGRKNGNTTMGSRSDERLPYFYIYGDGKDTLKWKVSSSTQTIPKAGEGNIDPAFWQQNGDSQSYNALEYNQTEIIPLGVIGSIDGQQYYIKKSDLATSFNGINTIKVDLRLNPFLKDQFSTGLHNANRWKLSYMMRAGIDGENHPVVNRLIKGERGEEGPFSLIPKGVYAVRDYSIGDKDTILRVNDINNRKPNSVPLKFDSTSQVVERNNKVLNDNLLNVIANNEQELVNKGGYIQILNDAKNSTLSLNLLNLLSVEGDNGISKNFYPFLEYKIEAEGEGKIADRFFTILGEGKVNQYNIRMQVKKPTLQQPALGSFTIIF